MRRVRPALYVLGVAVVAASLLGARALTGDPASAKQNTNGEQKTAIPAGNGGARVAGPVVLGTVDTDPQPIPYFLPPVLQSGTIVERLVTDGMTVATGDALYKFDTSLQERDLEKARAAVAVEKTKVDAAQAKAKQHARMIENQKQVVALAEQKKQLQANYFTLVKNNLEQTYQTLNYDKETWPTRLRDDPTYYKANAEWVQASGEVDMEKAKLATLEVDDPQVLVRQAQAGVNLAEEEAKKAQTAIDLCAVRAKINGTVERVTVAPGSTIGIGTREPALWLIPTGPRIVRAEVEADFAHRVGADLKGKEVTVYDNTDPRLTYKGVVRHVGGTFLPKRSAGEASILGNDTRVLEAIVEVADPAPAGKPPLRVGQRVRVSLGQ